MTVEELIKELQEIPDNLKNIPVIYIGGGTIAWEIQGVDPMIEYNMIVLR